MIPKGGSALNNVTFNLRSRQRGSLQPAEIPEAAGPLKHSNIWGAVWGNTHKQIPLTLLEVLVVLWLSRKMFSVF